MSFSLCALFIALHGANIITRLFLVFFKVTNSNFQISSFLRLYDILMKFQANSFYKYLENMKINIQTHKNLIKKNLQ